jgi:hypothetical protein
MIAVFLSFVTQPDPIAQMFGIGLAFAVPIDATIVRAVLVPAAMVLLGDAKWWLPGWLDRILPRMHGIGEFWGYPERRAFAELLIGCEEDLRGPVRPRIGREGGGGSWPHLSSIR